jgi:two-component system phosphate regulon sensor histidine kinase PhoR
MNQMAAQLDERIRIITRQRNQLEAVLSSMVEAVLVADASGRLIQVNRAAAQLFALDPEEVVGAAVSVTIRNADLQQFLRRILESQAPEEEDIVLEQGGEKRHLRALGTRLRGPSGQSLGALVVLHDVTKLKRLEAVRRDFVANVSHELKTPITSIQGFVETLRDGAIEDPDNARRFLEIIAHHAERLNAIIEDLLSLSRIELEGEAGEIALTPGRVKEVLEAAVQLCETKAAEREVTVAVAGDPELEAPINAALLEQAIVNLIDNAIKYTDVGGQVRVSVEAEEDDAVITVEDTGRGIPPGDQPRIFERFYRVDKARSRDQGGTGLGLAIVKHIAVAHRGLVSLASEPGRGSIFRIRLPRL